MPWRAEFPRICPVGKLKVTVIIRNWVNQRENMLPPISADHDWERIKGKGDGWRQFLCSRCSQLFLTSSFLSPSVLPLLLLSFSPRRREIRSCSMFRQPQRLPHGLDLPSALRRPPLHWELVESARGGLSLTLTRTTRQRLNPRVWGKK